MKKKWIILIGIIIIILILGISLPIFKKALKTSFGYISNPIIESGNFFSNKTKGFFNIISKIKKLAAENQELKKELLELKKQETDFQILEKENEQLSKQLSYFKENPFENFVTGKIIYKDPTRLQNYLTINIGEKDGIKENYPVISQGVLIGKVTEVNQNTSKVFLITNPDSLISALVLPSQSLGLVKGQLGYGLLIESLAREAKINTGDYVVTSGTGDYPKGLLIGQIAEITSGKNDVFQSANIRPLFEYSTIEIISVLKLW